MVMFHYKPINHLQLFTNPRLQQHNKLNQCTKRNKENELKNSHEYLETKDVNKAHQYKSGPKSEELQLHYSNCPYYCCSQSQSRQQLSHPFWQLQLLFSELPSSYSHQTPSISTKTNIRYTHPQHMHIGHMHQIAHIQF